jgi:hypothetical protein
MEAWKHEKPSLIYNVYHPYIIDEYFKCVRFIDREGDNDAKFRSFDTFKEKFQQASNATIYFGSDGRLNMKFASKNDLLTFKLKWL